MAAILSQPQCVNTFSQGGCGFDFECVIFKPVAVITLMITSSVVIVLSEWHRTLLLCKSTLV